MIQLLTIDGDQLDLLTELAIQAQGGSRQADTDFEIQKAEAVALCKRRIQAAVHLYGDGRIDRPEYVRRVEANEREIAHWEARTTETEKAALELAMCVETVHKSPGFGQKAATKTSRVWPVVCLSPSSMILTRGALWVFS